MVSPTMAKKIHMIRTLPIYLTSLVLIFDSMTQFRSKEQVSMLFFYINYCASTHIVT